MSGGPFNPEQLILPIRLIRRAIAMRQIIYEQCDEFTVASAFTTESILLEMALSELTRLAGDAIPPVE